MESPSKLLLVLLGPTAVGKTELSLRLAKLLSCPVISADSRQIYDTIRIGTATPTAEQLAQAQHFFVGKLHLDQYYSAAQYEREVLLLLDQHFRHNDTALLAGGSMMYIDAVCKGIDDIPTIHDDTRAFLRRKLDEQGPDALLAELRLLDPDYYAIADLKNTRRLVHALEVCYQTGKSYTAFRTRSQKPRPFRVLKVGLTRHRESLFSRINQRVEAMMREGLLEEARSVYPLRHLNSLNTVGYKELFRVLAGEWELPMAVERIKKNTRVYAKKQLTWFRRDDGIHWLNLDECSTDDALGRIAALMREGK